MGKRAVCYWLLPLCAGCAVLSPPDQEAGGPPAPRVSPVGQAAGLSDAAGKMPAPPAEDDSLKRAAECLERGDDAAALPHLTRYVAAKPDHATIRAHLAEVLM